MLVLARKSGEMIRIDLMEGVDPRTPLGDLFAAGSIEITIASIKGTQVKIGIQAEQRFRVLRGELCVLGVSEKHRVPRSGTDEEHK